MPTRRMMLEPLEARENPGNLRLDNVVLVDGNNNPISNVVTGQQVVVRAEWTMSGFSTQENYVVRFRLGGVDFDSSVLTTQSGTSTWNWYRYLWIAKPGVNSVTVTVDGASAIAESNEADNSQTFDVTPTTPVGPSIKFVWPVSSKPTQAWKVNNYADIDPRSGFAQDYRGGEFQYDGHDAFDIDTGTHTQMDLGVPIVAIAPGTVTYIEDGYFDRETTGNNRPGNHVWIDHGGGWKALYYHLAANSITVKVGDTVSANQLIGLMGSSGSSTQAHLHFNVYFNNALVETMYSPAAYFATPPVYQGEASPVVIANGVSNEAVWTDFKEGPSNVAVFPTSKGWDAWAWFSVANFPTGQPARIEWYRPNGTLSHFYTHSPSQQRGGSYAWITGAGTYSPHPGLWNVVMTIGGKEVARSQFRVVTGTGEPEVRVRESGVLVVDERTTPFDFGSVASGASAPTKTFTIENHGAEPLNLSGPQLPTGFSFVGSFPSTVNAGSSQTFTVRMDTATAGSKFGSIRFNTNDSDEASYNFLLKGIVTGTVPTGTPTVTVPGPAIAYRQGSAPSLIAPSATIFDTDHPNFGTGQLQVEIVHGGSSFDRLEIRSVGNGVGEVSVSGSQVSFEGAVVGTISGGIGAPMTVTFNGIATPAIAQAVLRNVTYRTVAPTNDLRARFLTVTVTDPDGKFNTGDFKRIVPYVDPVNDAPTVLGVTPQLNPVTESDPNPPGQSVASFLAASVSDPDQFDPIGIAIVGRATGLVGEWQYSLNGGVSWASMGNPSSSAARLLRPTDWVRFVPTTGRGLSNLTYRAWDQTTGVPGGLVDLTLVGATGGSTAYSSGTQIAELMTVPINAAPSFSLGANLTLLEDSSLQSMSNFVTNIDPGRPTELEQIVTFQVATNRPDLFTVPPSIDGDGTLSFELAANANGTATVSVIAKDDGGTAFGGQDTSATQFFDIVIDPVNDTPSFSGGSNITVDEDAAPFQLSGWATNILAGPANESSQEVSFVATASRPELFAAGPEITPSGQLRFTVANNANGTANISVMAFDNGGTANGGSNSSLPQDFSITIRPINDAPIANSDSATVFVGRPVTLPVLFNDTDADGDVLTLVSVSQANHGTVARSGTRLIYTPRTEGFDSFTYTVRDPSGATAVGNVTLTVRDLVAPKVVDVTIGLGAASSTGVMALPRGILPWESATTVSIRFSEIVQVVASDLTVTGLAGPYSLAFRGFNPANRTATWDILTPLPTAGDRLNVRLSGGIVDVSNNSLGAGWTKSLAFLPGDFDGNGVVDARDVAGVKRAVMQRTYNRFADINGDGLLTTADTDRVSLRLGNRLR